MQNNFNVIMSSLRKERGISQKQAAADLGVSQSLLSHYENGIRECGLSFLGKAADYYGVTTDYLLGRTDCACAGQKSSAGGGAKSGEQKRSLLNAAEVLLELICRCEDDEMTDTALQICRLQLYYTVRVVSCIYRNNSFAPENSHAFFMDAGEILRLSENLKQLSAVSKTPPEITDEELRQEFAELYTDLKVLIKEVGRNLV